MYGEAQEHTCTYISNHPNLILLGNYSMYIRGKTGYVKQTVTLCMRMLCHNYIHVCLSSARVQPGKCYHLFTQHQLGLLADYQPPEMLRTPLEELVLQIKILKLGAAATFLDKAIEPPSESAVLNALSCLRQLVESPYVQSMYMKILQDIRTYEFTV